MGNALEHGECACDGTRWAVAVALVVAGQSVRPEAVSRFIMAVWKCPWRGSFTAGVAVESGVGVALGFELFGALVKLVAHGYCKPLPLPGRQFLGTLRLLKRPVSTPWNN